MRIFELIESSSNLSLKENRVWYRNLYEPLIDLGHDVLLFPAKDGRRAMQDSDHLAKERFSQRVLDKFLKENERHSFDLFFSYLMDGMIDPGVIDEIRRIGVPTCNFSCNNIHQFYLVDELVSSF